MARNNTSTNRGVFTSLKKYLDRSKIGELLVIKGQLSPSDLKHALILQQQSKRALGEVLVAHNFITHQDLSQILRRQRTVRFAATFCLCFMSFGIGVKKAKADYIQDIPAKISVVSEGDNLQFVSLQSYPALFGSTEKRSNNLEAFTKWIDMFERFDATMNKPASRKILQSLQAELQTFKSSSIRDMAEKVNHLMNEKKYIVDSKNWGKSDYWATPIEFLARGGDCEDFAIAKYFAMRALGVPENRLRISIVHDNQKNIPHAILIVYAEDGPVVLDNQIDHVVNANSIKHYRPIFSINRISWWLHTTSPEETIVASAAQ